MLHNHGSVKPCSLCRRIYETATNQLVSFLDLVSDQLSGSSPSRAKSALDLLSLTDTSRLSLAPSALSRSSLDFLGLDQGSDLLGRSSRASLGSDLSASRAAAMAAANIRLSLGGGAAGSSGSSLELNNRLRRGARPGRAMPRMGVEGAGLYKAAAAAAAVGERQHGGQNIWRSRSEAGIPGKPSFYIKYKISGGKKGPVFNVFFMSSATGSEEKRTGRGHQRRPPRAEAALAGHQPAGGIRTSRNLKYPQV
jgi:hypothetical protein